VGTAFGNPGSPQSIAGANGGKTYAFNNVTSVNNIPVAPANPSRQSITFVNPGTVTIYVSMVSQLSLTGVQSPLTPSLGALGGTIALLAGTFANIIGGEIQLGWQAMAASGTANPFTAIDSNA
jgi:hypothetical protein